jgi:nicotinamide-nucleotide amidase
MPGVPYEMQAMVSDFIIPKLKKDLTLPSIYHKTILTQGIGESALAEIIEEWEDGLASKNIKLAYLPQPGMVRLRLSSYGNNESEVKQNVEEQVSILLPQIQKYVYGFEAYGEETKGLEHVISGLLKEKNKTLALAESCTGGYIASLITAIPGASEIFKGGIIPYTNKAKHDLLQVDENVFTKQGAVSEECVTQLSKNVLQKFDTDFSIAVSGIAGPSGGTAEKPVGMVWIAVSSREKTIAMKFQFGENRGRNIIMTARAGLNLLRKLVLKEI